MGVDPRRDNGIRLPPAPAPASVSNSIPSYPYWGCDICYGFYLVKFSDFFTDVEGLFVGVVCNHCISICAFNPCCFIVGQCHELIGSGTTRQDATVLLEEAEQQIDGAVRHINNGFNLAAECIVIAKEGCLKRQVFFDCLLDA